MSTLFGRYSLIPTTAFFCAALLGFCEAIWLLQNTGAPDRLSLFYSVLLYGFVGGLIGLAVMLPFRFLNKPFFESKQHFLGALSIFMSIGSFVLFYQIRKVVYAEQMPPISILLTMEVSLLLASTIFLIPVCTKFLRLNVLRVLTGLLFFSGLTGWMSLPGGSSSFSNPITREESNPDRPNVLFLFIDTLRADHIGAYNEKEINTPHMNSLAKDGVLFEQSYAQASWTRPSGVSIFSSRIPSGHSTQIKAAAAPDDAVFFTEVLHDAGVRTAGLANNINLTATFNLDQGYDAFLYTEPEYPLFGSESVFGLTLYKVLEKLVSRFGSKKNRSVHTYYQPATTLFSLSESFLENNKDYPWMLYVHLMEPHDPYFAHPVLNGEEGEYSGIAYGRKEHEHPDPKDLDLITDLYRQEVEYLDTKIGDFLTYLKENNLYENTMIVLVSDHGEEFNEHGGFWHGTTLYDEVLRVPLIIKPANGTLKNIRVPWQVRSIDIAPTITAALGLSPDPSWEGQNLFSEAALMAIKHPDRIKQDCLSQREHPMDRIVIAENNFEGNILSSIRMRGFKYILANKENNRNLAPEELYNLPKDKGEQQNIISSIENICNTPTETHSQTLKLILGETLNTALKTAVSSSGVDLDEATIEKMRALGYMSDQE
jgi:arylsulfatase A-like enzyme